MNKVPEIFDKAEASIMENYRRLVENKKWLDYPMVVSIETYAKCNASCNFCPYPSLDRKGEMLDGSRILRIIDEVSKYPVHPQRLNFSRVNEPLLDHRLPDFLEYASDRLPQTDLILFTNGQALTEKAIHMLNGVTRFKSLTISFNECKPQRYRDVMSLDIDKTIMNIERLHEMCLRGELNFSVNLSRVGSSNAEDDEYLRWCADRFPGFPVSCSAKFDWVGFGKSYTRDLVPNAGCLQWFSVHVLADGRSAFCCIDGVGRELEYDGATLLEIYNLPAKRRLREVVTSRRDVDLCNGCVHSMPSAAYINYA